MEEVWKDIPGYEGLYQVSSSGNVKTMTKTTVAINRWGSESTRTYPEKLMMVSINTYRQNRRYVVLRKDKQQKMHLVSWLVAAAFIGPRPANHHVCHNNGNAQDDRVENLRYDTAKGNTKDKYLHGTVPIGDAHPGCKLTSADVTYIRQSSASRYELAAMFNVHHGHIYNVRKGFKRAMA